MKFPTYKEMGEKVAKEALDTFEYNGKTLREWIEIIASNDGDTISRKAAIDAIKNLCKECDADHCGECRIDHPDKDAKSVIEALPSADEPSQVARDIARIVENEQDMRVIAQSEKRTETHGVCLDAISRQAAIDAVQNRHMMLSKEKVLLINDLKKLPPVEPQIIRCKNCKYWVPYDWMFSEVWQSKNIADYPEDEIGCNLCDIAMKANDFCSQAERRTE